MGALRVSLIAGVPPWSPGCVLECGRVRPPQSGCGSRLVSSTLRQLTAEGSAMPSPARARTIL